MDVNLGDYFWNIDGGRNDFVKEPRPWPSQRDMYEAAHTDYTIYTQDGKVFEHVKNARNYEDPQPALVSLPAGSYKIEARAHDYGWVTVPVVIETNKLTVVNLQRAPIPALRSIDRADAVMLGGERILGWRANLAGQP